MYVNQLKAGAILNYIVIFLSTVIGLLYTPYMLRMMGQSEYGIYSIVASVIAYLTVLDLGLGNAIVRYTAKYRAQDKQKEQYEMFGMFFLLYCLIGVISFIGGVGIYLNVDDLFGDTMTSNEIARTRIMMIILIFNLAFTFPMSIFGSIMTAYEKFVFPKLITIIRLIISTLIMILLLEYGYRAVAMVVLQTIFNVVTLLINYYYCRRKLKIKLSFGRFQWGFLREVSIYSFWIFLNVIMDKIYWNTGQFVLGAESGTVEVSIFAVAIQLQVMYMMFSTAISSVFLPKVTGMVTRSNDARQISDLFIRTGRIQNVIMSAILFGFIVFGKRFITLWAGNNYTDAYYITVLFYLALYIPLIQNLGITILQARNQMKFRSLLYIVIAVLALIGEVLLAKIWSGIGCALAIAIALWVGQGLVMNIYYHLRQKIDIITFWKEIIKMDFAPAIISIVALFALKLSDIENTWSSLILGILIYIIVYIPACIVFSMNKNERKEFVYPLFGKLKHIAV